MTVIMEGTHNPDNAESSLVTWDTTEMEFYLDKGLCEKIETTERIGIHPYWLRNIVVGAMEELREHLGKWSKEFQGYLIGFQRPCQLPVPGKQGQYPFPYIYYKFNIVRYIYRPAIGQNLKGVITNTGDNAASCVVFQTFVATVYPQSQQEFYSWKVGDEVNFTVDALNELRRGVVLTGTSIEQVGRSMPKNKHIRLDEDPIEVQVEEVTVAEDEPPKKKKKKDKKIKEKIITLI